MMAHERSQERPPLARVKRTQHGFKRSRNLMGEKRHPGNIVLGPLSFLADRAQRRRPVGGGLRLEWPRDLADIVEREQK
jgi:hypothetical protein